MLLLQICNSGTAYDCQQAIDFVSQNLNGARRTGLAGGRYAIQGGTPDHDRVSAESHRLDDVTSASKPTIDDDRELRFHRIHDIRQHVDGSHCAVANDTPM